MLHKASLTAKNIAAIGITNQRETTIIWNRKTGEPIYNAIVWQDRRTSAFCDEIRKNHGELIRKKTGLEIDAYFSASKINWILENVPNARKQAENGKLLFGTVDSWLFWKLTNGKKHLTDVFSTAFATSRRVRRPNLLRSRRYKSNFASAVRLRRWFGF